MKLLLSILVFVCLKAWKFIKWFWGGLRWVLLFGHPWVVATILLYRELTPEAFWYEFETGYIFLLGGMVIYIIEGILILTIYGTISGIKWLRNNYTFNADVDWLRAINKAGHKYDYMEKKFK